MKEKHPITLVLWVLERNSNLLFLFSHTCGTRPFLKVSWTIRMWFLSSVKTPADTSLESGPRLWASWKFLHLPTRVKMFCFWGHPSPEISPRPLNKTHIPPSNWGTWKAHVPPAPRGACKVSQMSSMSAGRLRHCRSCHGNNSAPRVREPPRTKADEIGSWRQLERWFPAGVRAACVLPLMNADCFQRRPLFLTAVPTLPFQASFCRWEQCNMSSLQSSDPSFPAERAHQESCVRQIWTGKYAKLDAGWFSDTQKVK